MADLFDIDRTARISELVTLIKKYQKSYYNGESEISDFEFDKLWDELKILDPENPILKKVGADNGNFQKVRHIMPMGSQEKAANPEQFLSWCANHSYPEYLVEYKLDGASLELQYNHGKLMVAVTRGDGSVGDDITANAKKMQGIPHVLKNIAGELIDYSGGVRGEVIMTHKIHNSFYSDKANCRNAANGLMKRKDGDGCNHLTFIAYDALSITNSQPFDDEESKIKWLSNCSFNVVPLKICKSAEDVIAYRSSVMESRNNLDYDIDGLVIKERIINYDDAKRARPDRQIAFKFSLEEAVSILREVEWSESGSTYTPVAIFDSVSLAGTTVQRASLANPETMRNLGIKIGCKVVVVKRGEIIPKIESVIDDPSLKTIDVVYPSVCSSCNTKLIDEGSRLFCPNQKCEKKILHQLLKWVNVVDIRDLGETLVTSLFNSKIVRSISDLYSLTTEQLTPFFLTENSIAKNKDSAGALKVYESIQSHRHLSLPSFIAGFDIAGIGEVTVQKLVDAGFNTLEKLFSATEEDFATTYGFAQIMAKDMVVGLKENKKEMESLVLNGVIILEQSTVEGIFTGMSFCFTGELNTMKRSEAENLVKQNGGTCKSSVTKDLSYLVTNDTSSGSSKNLKAQKFGIKIINEEDFLVLVGK